MLGRLVRWAANNAKAPLLTAPPPICGSDRHIGRVEGYGGHYVGPEAW